MRNSGRRELQVICAVGILLLLALILFPLFLEEEWVGSTDLTVEFVVTDAHTSQPVRGADVSILSRGGFNADGARLAAEGRKEEELRFTTCENGMASYLCRDCLCEGTSSRLGFTDTYSVRLPRWRVTVGANGYAPHGPFHLGEVTYPRAVKRLGPQRAKLLVPITLRKT